MSNGRRDTPKSIHPSGPRNPAIIRSRELDTLPQWPSSSSRRREFHRFHNPVPSTDVLCNRYDLHEKLGFGGMAEVYSAIDRKSGQRVAIKLLVPYIGDDKSNRFRDREMIALSSIHHDNVVRLLGIGKSDHDGRDFFVLEYIDGKGLNEILHEDWRLPWKRAKPIMLQLCDALQAVHDAMIVHRDLKPSNIMVISAENEEKIKLIDFGTAFFMDPKNLDINYTASGQLIGTTSYLAPEMVAWDPFFDHRADIYGAGLILYEMLTGRNPFRKEASSGFEQIPLIREKMPPHPSGSFRDIPEELGAVVMRSIAKKPKDRYQRIKDLSEAIRACR